MEAEAEEAAEATEGFLADGMEGEEAGGWGSSRIMMDLLLLLFW